MAIDTDGYILSTINLQNNPNEGDSGIYFLQSSEGYIKVGKSGSLSKRLATYKTHNSTIRLVGFIWEPVKYMDFAEITQHKLWGDFRISGEWFAPVKPLVKYISLFHNGCGISVYLYQKTPKVYQDLIRTEQENRESYEVYVRQYGDELRAQGWKI